MRTPHIELFPGLAIGLALSCLTCGGPDSQSEGGSSVSETRETPELTEAWKAYRAAFPYPMQEIGISDALAGSKRALIVSEPPPHVDLEEFAALDPVHITKVETREQTLGYGGWLKDVVAEVHGSDADIANLIERLSKYLYGTAYKAHAMRIPSSNARKNTHYPLDISPTVGEVRSWVLMHETPLSPVDGSAQTSVEAVFDLPTSEVFYSTTAGLLTWWLPRAIGIADAVVQARQFALDSDLIVGAIGTDNGVLIVGRERQVPLSVLPPLRAETMALLDGVSTDELAQSYERLHFLAGRCDQTTDWAPAYLCSELLDTEYGALLNVADQILKGWSNSGLTTYRGFEEYPEPDRWPFTKALPKHLGVDELTYNWNTSGAGYAVLVDNREIFAPNRTGALPVSYIPGEKARASDAKVVKAEATAYDYFGSLSEPTLVRVVQYASLYQICRHLHQGEESTDYSNAAMPEPKLKDLEYRLLLEASDCSPEDLDNVVDHLLQPNPQAEAESPPSAASRDTLRELVGSVLGELRGHESTVMQLLSNRSARLVIAQVDTLADAAKMISEVLIAYAAVKGLPSRFSQSFTGSGWIHTPVVVLSNNTGAIATAVGGHNLRAAITEFELDSSVPRGLTRTVERNGRSFILVNPESAERLPSVVRAVGKYWDDAQGAATEARVALRRATPREIRKPDLGLALTKSPQQGPPLARGLDLHADQAGIEYVQAGKWGSRQTAVVAEESGLSLAPSSPSTPRAVIERFPDQTYRVEYEPGKAVVYYTEVDAVHGTFQTLDRVGVPGPKVVELRGMSSTDAESFLLSARMNEGAATSEAAGVGFVRNRGFGGGVATELQRMKLDFGKVSIKQLATEDPLAPAFEVELPSLQTGALPLRVRIRVLFSKLTSSETIGALLGRIKARLQWCVSSSKEPLELNTKIQLEMRKIMRESNKSIDAIQHQIHTEASEAAVVENQLGIQRDSFASPFSRAA